MKIYYQVLIRNMFFNKWYRENIELKKEVEYYSHECYEKEKRYRELNKKYKELLKNYEELGKKRGKKKND